MSSIVVELQTEALDRKIRTSDLLRKALVVARKLNIQEFRDWAEHELKGYSPDEEAPDYRKIRCQIKGWNPYHNGWMPVFYKDEETEETFSYKASGQPIAELEELIKNSGEDSFFMMPCPSSISLSLSKSVGFLTEFVSMVSPAGIIGIIDAVRNRVLNWALKLEEDGILGEELSFTKEEKQKAAMTTNNVNNFFGAGAQPHIHQSSGSFHQGDVTMSNIKIDRSVVGSINTGEIEKLDVSLENIRVGGDETLARELQDFINAVLVDKALGEEERNKIVEHTSFIAEQAALPQEKRRPGIIRMVTADIANLITISTVLSALWDRVYPLIRPLLP